MATTEVLIAGAGPTGLVLALSLARRGVPFRLVDPAAGPGEHSRAMAVQARTLEFYRQFGIAEEVIAEGVVARRVHVGEASGHGRARAIASVDVHDIGEGISPYPFMLTYPQDLHERLLIRRLSAMGVEVERGVGLAGFTQDGAGVRATLRRADGSEETAEASWLCGCDGAHSQVRHTLDPGFPGGTYEQLFYVVDVKIEGGFDQDIHANIGERILALMFPVRASGMQRLIGLVPPELSHREDLSFEDVRGAVEPLLGIKVTEVNWFSHYRVHHRVAGRFRVGRAFLLGDAGHLHSPAGGQGMNTGIGDAVNLAWKLADVVQGRAPERLLESYEPERIGFARTLVQTTDRAFTPMVAGGLAGELFRRLVAPAVAGVGARLDWTRHAAFRTVSQVHIHYPDSPLSEGSAGHVKGGDRLPWTGGEGGPDDFAPLDGLGWRLQVHGSPAAPVAEAAGGLGLPLDAFPWSEAARRAGLAEHAGYLLRPDGHVALAWDGRDAAPLRAYVKRQGLRLATPVPA